MAANLTNLQLYALAVRAGCRPIWRAAIVRGKFEFAHHCACAEGQHGAKSTGLITLESLSAP